MDKMVSESQETRRGHVEGEGMAALERVAAGGPSGADIPAERRQSKGRGRKRLVCEKCLLSSSAVLPPPHMGETCTPACLKGAVCGHVLPGLHNLVGFPPFKGQPSRRASTPGLCEPDSSQCLWACIPDRECPSLTPQLSSPYGNTSQLLSLASLWRVQLLAQTLGPNCLQPQQPWAWRSSGQVDCRREGKPRATC